jgi:hypothetical protein
MEHAVEAVQGMAKAGMSDRDKADFRQGVQAVLDYLEGFWMGLERRAAAERRPPAAHSHAA